MNLRPQEEENVEENSLLCADNYTPYEEVDELKIIKSEIKPIDKKKKNSSTTGLQNASIVIRTKPGLSKFSSNAHSEMDAFSILFTNQIYENIVQYTNERITNTLQKF